MNCDLAANFIWARLDGELTGDDALELDAHLAECAACRAMVAEAEVHDAALVRAFSSRQVVAGTLADRVTRIIEAEAGAAPSATSRLPSRRWPHNFLPARAPTPRASPRAV